ncbi:SurA N-terminal domain-containing protein [Kiritimatiella glycovorans]|uniref:Peptidyl-prolyl cis-trans isomerase D n=1 Tax=Kiritimatiella glycovorans TaxID=1307763 RepID=A0A0G3ELG3_9BACT|nr:SurA N-terminal domain-containing protein [Kiritimatiella glycovorans]AKJ64974.1 Peptidyl-prolyl cis-trans isomerase D [Kiritimatiella glycovorans]
MMLARFHKIIQSKAVWTAICILICIAFLGFFAPGMGGSGGGRERSRAAGELYGKEISSREFRSAYHDVYLRYILMFGRELSIDERMDTLLREAAWQRLAMLRKADRLDIRASDEEVRAAIRSQPMFRGEQGFNRTRYDNFVNAMLPRMGYSVSALESLFRDEVRLQKLRFRPALAALVTPGEVRQAFHSYADEYELEYALVTTNQLEEPVTVAEDRVRAYYQNHADRFKMPEKVRVQYVRFPVEPYLDEVEVAEEEARRFYDRNLEQYRAESGQEEASTNDAPAYLPFEQVRGEIETELRRRRALNLAADEATELVIDLTPGREGKAPAFEQAAEGRGLEIRTLPAFARDADLKPIASDRAFIEAAFSLQNTADRYFSDAVAGEDAVYVIALEKRLPSFVPPFDTVEAQVRAAVRREARREALEARADLIRDRVAEAVSGGRTFAEALKPFGLTPERTPPFSPMQGPEDDPLAPWLSTAATRAGEGEIASPLPFRGDRYLIAHVAAYTPGDESGTLPGLRPELVSFLRRDRINRLLTEAGRYTLEEAGFRDYRAEREAEGEQTAED